MDLRRKKRHLRLMTLAIAAVVPFFLVTAAFGASHGEPVPREIVSGNKQDFGGRSCEGCRKFNELNTSIRDGRVDKADAMARFKVIIKELEGFAGSHDFPATSSVRCVFPLKGYDASAIGGRRGSGYVEGGYDYFDGNAHTGHPAHDLFIRDRNRDSLDDTTGKAVAVLAMDGGIVVAVETKWEKGSPLRGGRYIWIYNPSASSLIYYAHNEAIFVGLGDVVKPGDKIATVGRTGLNADRRRSPTHLHLMHLKIINGRPRAHDRFGVFPTCRFQ